ncbi:MAG TPA: hypothetical protein VM285_13555, partial [Polyangia bacterium]|nr:hypothetical protein [Polyangia bacterium]
MKTHHGILTVLFAVALLAGCGDDDKAKDDGGPDGGDGESLSFVVMEWSLDEDTWVPLEGATVAFDAPGGERTEAVSGADGTVTFEGIDWSLGTAAATAHAEGYVLASVVDVEPSVVGQLFSVDGAVALLVNELTTAPETVSVSGTATGLLDTAHDLVVNVVGVMAGSENIV